MHRLGLKLALAALLVVPGVAGTGCVGTVPAGPPILYADECGACRQNCRWRGRLCTRSSRSPEACGTEGAGCEMRCVKSFCESP